jgi:SHS2 domain-containing protein
VAIRGYEVIEHTADIGLRVWGQAFEDVFAEAAVALVAVMGTASGGDPVTERVALDAPDVDSLFVDWLSEILFLFEAREIVPRDVRVLIDRDGWKLEATIDGAKAPAFVQEGPTVKAITYHALEVTENEATVYLDV